LTIQRVGSRLHWTCSLRSWLSPLHFLPTTRIGPAPTALPPNTHTYSFLLCPIKCSSVSLFHPPFSKDSNKSLGQG
uniref:Uncharacterized protein n=1 Tax=Aegilops tauschii subsp. strangulata TaxID=200361 RepID=A0A453IAJ0_AEGTS